MARFGTGAEGASVDEFFLHSGQERLGPVIVKVLGDEAFVHFNLPVRCLITPDIEELLADRGEDASSLGDETETAKVSMDAVVNPGDTLKLTVDTRRLHLFDPDTADHITGQR